ncbi:MAG TPA: DNA-3-methyladenine glycosylase 2 family protein [Flavisolibacter sp.]|nr:DNA-3-methyladenine glycosylase 2 family protein [Flavisolibacter sp.]
MERFTADNFESLCHMLAKSDRHFKTVIKEYGIPPMWTRPNSFSSLVLTILEQQVSIASAYAAYKKLKAKTGGITPARLLALSDEDLRACYLSRQKIVYTRGLANAILSKQIDLRKFRHQPDELIRAELKKLKGIGDWTVDIYLLHCLGRTDVFPLGDLALVNSIKMLKKLPGASKEELLQLSEAWKPYRSIATMIFWHYYIRKRNIKVLA